jgi:ketosteroid isomerase-like protein
MEANMNDAEDIKAAAAAVWAAFATRDAARVRAVLTDDVEWIAPANNATALALRATHHMIGPEPIVDFLSRSFGTLFVRDVASEVRHCYADGNTVIFERRITATLANGRHYDNDYCFILEMVGPRVRRIREYMDTRKGYAQIFGDNAAPPVVTG